MKQRTCNKLLLLFRSSASQRRQVRYCDWTERTLRLQPTCRRQLLISLKG